MIEQEILLGDLVYYIGPPIVSPLSWKYITENDNGIISKNDLAIVIDLDSFLKIANLFFQRQEIEIKRVSFKHLELVQ